jgi:hypothetical protein
MSLLMSLLNHCHYVAFPYINALTDIIIIIIITIRTNTFKDVING